MSNKLMKEIHLNGEPSKVCKFSLGNLTPDTSEAGHLTVDSFSTDSGVVGSGVIATSIRLEILTYRSLIVSMSEDNVSSVASSLFSLSMMRLTFNSKSACFFLSSALVQYLIA